MGRKLAEASFFSDCSSNVIECFVKKVLVLLGFDFSCNLLLRSDSYARSLFLPFCINA